MKITSPILAKDFHESFCSLSKNYEIIWRKLLVENKPLSDKLKKLLIINNKDCLDDSNYQYQKIIESYNISDMIDKQYIRTIPKILFGEFEEVKSYILLEIDDITPSENPEFRNCTISFTILSHLDYWNLDNYQLRPWVIAGLIDSIMDKSKLSGIGQVNFMGASQIVISEYLGGVMLRYLCVNGSDDKDFTNQENML